MLSLRGPYKVVLRWLKFDRGAGVQQTRKLEPLQKSDNRLAVKLHNFIKTVSPGFIKTVSTGHNCLQSYEDYETCTNLKKAPPLGGA